MRKYFLLVLTVATMMSIAACEKDIPNDQEETIDVKLTLCGDVDFIDEPLTKAWGESNSVYGISVYVYNENVDSYERYAYGIFASASNLSITLTTSKKYMFEAVFIKQFTDKYCFVDNQYRAFTEPTDGFVYTSSYFYPAMWGPISSASKTNIIESDLYYGSITDYMPSSTCSITLDRKSFGIDMSVEGLQEGSVEFCLSGMKAANYITSMTVSYPETSISKIYSHRSYISNDSQKMWVEINYYDSSSNKTCIANEELVFEKCTRKKVKVTLQPGVPSQINQNVLISVVDNDYTDETVDYSGTI